METDFGEHCLQSNVTHNLISGEAVWLEAYGNVVLIPDYKVLISNPPSLQPSDPRHIYKHALTHTLRTTCEQHMGKYFPRSTLAQFIPLLIRSLLSA